MGHLTVELFELHDRKKFEIHAVSFYGPDDSDVQARIKAAADAFHDVSATTDPQVAALLHELKIDIAVDLMAHTQHARPAILAHRPAPVQVNYLGYPATMGGTFTDYIIADPIVLPMDQQPYYSEQIVHLPHSYQANDSRRPISEWKPTRAELGLPEKGFVFCCFNNTWKMTREIFEIWMRLLQAVPGSVLWLYRDHPEAARNLKAAAGARGVDPDRIVFAGPVKLEDHLARHRAADLFLDTLPYNAHTTCSDTLWAGLPIVTCKGDTFAGRVAASLLTSVGLPELITETLEDYEALALALANDPRRLKKIRAKLAAQRDTSALFDTKTFTRDLEAIYQRMWQTWQGRKT
jgi:predicted O-linked N-acetylglucosamine transferase (SPINDLY family)